MSLLPKGDLHIHVERNYRFHPSKLPLYLYLTHDQDMYIMDNLSFTKHEGYTNLQETLMLKEKAAQELIDDLYRAGFRPSDEIKKDDLIQTLKNEIDKRDKMIDNLMERFVFKSEVLNMGRKVIT